MKKLSSVLFVAAGLFATVQMTSCKKNKKEEPASLVGTWKSQTMNQKETIGDKVVIDTTQEYNYIELTFNADKTFSTNDLEDSTSNITGTYNTEESKLYITHSDGYKDTANYTVTKTQFTTIDGKSKTVGGVTTTREYKIVYVKK